MLTPVKEITQVGQARRHASELARAAGLDATREGRVALIATELATNLLKHAGGGLLAIERFADRDGHGVELLALDNGPGIGDLDRSLADGYSTAGSAGTGLGAVARQSDRFAVFSRPGHGSAIMARIRTPAKLAAHDTELGAVVDNYPGESVCGDGWSFAAAARGRTLLLVDGSGHGPEANRAARLALDTFHERSDDDCARIVEGIHLALGATRGAAVGLARIDAEAGLVRFVGVGNIAGTMVADDGVRRMVSHNGTAGHIAPRIREFTYPFAGAPLIVLHSDGLTTRWELAAYPGLAAQHASLIAGILFRDHRRGRDDASIVAMRA